MKQYKRSPIYKSRGTQSRKSLIHNSRGNQSRQSLIKSHGDQSRKLENIINSISTIIIDYINTLDNNILNKEDTTADESKKILNDFLLKYNHHYPIPNHLNILIAFLKIISENIENEKIIKVIDKLLHLFENWTQDYKGTYFIKPNQGTSLLTSPLTSPLTLSKIQATLIKKYLTEINDISETKYKKPLINDFFFDENETDESRKYYVTNISNNHVTEILRLLSNNKKSTKRSTKRSTGGQKEIKPNIKKTENLIENTSKIFIGPRGGKYKILSNGKKLYLQK